MTWSDRLRDAALWLWSRRYPLIYVMLVGWFVRKVSAYYEPHTGLTSMIHFGESSRLWRPERLRSVPVYTYGSDWGGDGYDGQWYATIGVVGNPFNPELATALDSPAYRTKRILIPLLVHALGFGRPGWVLEAYALVNIGCWLILAFVLSRWWFPPTDLHNLLGWVGTLFSAGMLMSVTYALTDGPAVLMIALGARCVERGRNWLGACVLGLSGLVREAAVLAATALPPRARPRGPALRWVLGMAVCVLPVVILSLVLRAYFGRMGGASTLAIPLTAFTRKVVEIWALWGMKGSDAEYRADVWAVVSLVVAASFILGRPQPHQPWWRIGATFSVLLMCLSWLFWETTPGMPIAACRALLPLTLAFNILRPRTRAGLVLGLLGNLTVLSAPAVLAGHPSEQTAFTEGVTFDYGSEWHRTEFLGHRTWRWSRERTAVLEFHNPNPRNLAVTLDFSIIGSEGRRTVTVEARGVRQTIDLLPRRAKPVHFGPFPLPPGDTSVVFSSLEPPEQGPALGRPLGFSLQALVASVTSN